MPRKKKTLPHSSSDDDFPGNLKIQLEQYLDQKLREHDPQRDVSLEDLTHLSGTFWHELQGMYSQNQYPPSLAQIKALLHYIIRHFIGH